MNKFNRKGFTLIELLVVIAIIAILAVVVILTLNPAQLLAQARDSNRTSDMATLKSAISLYLADVSSTYIGTTTICYISAVPPGADAGAVMVPTSASAPTSSFMKTPGTGGAASSTLTDPCGSWMVSATGVASSTARGINGPGSGWIPVNFSAISAGSPVGNLPVDPNNSTNNGTRGFYYSYMPYTANNTFKLATFMESTKYSASGSGDVTTNDGGNNVNVFEGGTNPGL
ncbi:MAG: type II secretion system protein [Patescibacteria group bacterium]|nr:type II secretion system protein [Patescibacteria group bacterium]